MRPILLASCGIFHQKMAAIHPSGQEMTFPRPDGLIRSACSAMVMAKYHFHLGLYKMSVMFTEMFLRTGFATLVRNKALPCAFTSTCRLLQVRDAIGDQTWIETHFTCSSAHSSSWWPAFPTMPISRKNSRTASRSSSTSRGFPSRETEPPCLADRKPCSCRSTAFIFAFYNFASPS